jgi:alpha-N-acetylglucosaminidase
MKIYRTLQFFLIFFLILDTYSLPAFQDVYTNNKEAYGVIQRLIGDRSKEILLKNDFMNDSLDVFEITAAGGKVVIRGNSTSAMLRGFYTYLKDACNSMVTWSGEHIAVPDKFPDYSSARIVSPYKLRLYYNVCTFGYTTAFWDWKRWEREIDWMALHGINMPLAMIGQEAVWQRVWKSFGLTDNDLKDYFTGPAFLPWHRMGNINKHDGPLPQSYLDKSIILQKKIIARMKELGMKPVVPAFAGFVPPALKRIYPEAEITDMEPWAGFEKGCGTYILSPKSDLFRQIGKKFIEEYQELFGKFDYYLADSFNEMKVPVTPENRYEELASYGKAVFQSINAGDPSGTWVMQGWLFYADSAFWDKKSASALLSKVPDNRMIIIDLADEIFQGWKKHDSFYGKKWIYSIIHNFGGHNNLFGDLKFIAEDPFVVLNDSDKGKLIGYGLSPEGIKNNEVVYELLTDAAWRNKEIDINEWLENYCRARYGECPEEIKDAWLVLLNTVYNTFNGNAYSFQLRPPFPSKDTDSSYKKVKKALQLLLDYKQKFGMQVLYRNNIIDVTAYYWGKTVNHLLYEAGSYFKNDKKEKSHRVFNKAYSLMLNLDMLLAERKDYRLENWISFARKWGINLKEKDYYEEDAKRQITVWGGPYLSEYAAKFWSGLVKNYYAARWEKYYKSLITGKDFKMNSWEERWIMTPFNSKNEPILNLYEFINSVNRSIQ